jgi:mono/diheme cytochrome c family protein
MALLAGVTGLPRAARAADKVDYLTQIKPLLHAHCYSCHGGLQQKAGLRLDTVALALKGGQHGPAIIVRKPEKSLLLAKVSATDPAERMPREADPLKPEQIELLRRWIAAGAPAPKDEKPEPSPSDHWAFKPVVRPPLPRIGNRQSAIGNPVDAFINARLASAKLTPLPPAEKPVLIRRVHLDLTGLPPTREELHAFLADTSPDAYERVVDRLLNSPQHGERWARHWMDVWRYSDWFGRRMVPDVWNSAPQIWRWRDWIVKSLNADHGYDRMVKEMLAADEIAPLDDETAVATGYLVRNWYALNPNEWMRANVEHIGKAFLGLTFNCAHCHDHKYDPITQADYFSFRAFFEPLYVRQDRWPGEADPGPFQDYDYSKLRKVQRLGSVRVFDKDAAAKTWFYTGGDERNRDTNRPPVLPAMPAFLGGKSLQVASVSLPTAAYYPGLRTAIQETELKERRTAITTAEAELAALKQTNAAPTAAQRDAVAKAEANFNTALAESAKSGKPAALAGKQSLVLDATAGRRVLVHSLAGLNELSDGATVRYQLRILTDKYAGFQLAKDTVVGLTAAYVGFVGGKIHSYSPGTTKEFEAGRYAFTNGQHTFEVTLALEPKADRALLTVRSLSDGKTLVDQTPIAISGWNPAKHKSQGILLDAQAGTVAVWDELSVSAGSGKNFHFDFESPRFADGKDVVGIEGWEAARFSVAPATSTVSSIALNRSLADKRLAVLAARRVLELPSLALAAAESKLTAARAELHSTEARLVADTAKHGRADLPVGLGGAPVSDPARSASLAERETAVVSAKSKLAAAQFALAEAETKSSTNTTRAAALQTAGKQLTDAQTALTKAESALADPKLVETYTAFSPVYPRESTGRRKALAEWIASRDNPLTARVAVNHIWARHFHEPLVASVFDFGRSGKPPTHPELLDWLAAEFMESGWSMKHLHRLIVTSAAYRRSSVAADVRRPTSSQTPDARTKTPSQSLLTSPATQAKVDSENKWLSRMNPGRMEAEVVRDSILHLAGALDSRMGGQELENKDALTTTRRSLYYSFNPESDGRSEFSALFDAPDANECYRRTRSVIPQQALALTNSKLVHDHTPAIAKRLGAPASDNAAFITAAFEQILTRPPSRAELAECEAFLTQQSTAVPKDGEARARESLVRALLNQNDFVTIR